MWKIALMLESIAQYLKKKSGGIHYYVLSFEFYKEEEREKFEELVHKKIYSGDEDFKVEYKVLTEYYD
jgi:hypothetical protein